MENNSKNSDLTTLCDYATTQWEAPSTHPPHHSSLDHSRVGEPGGGVSSLGRSSGTCARGTVHYFSTRFWYWNNVETVARFYVFSGTDIT